MPPSRVNLRELQAPLKAEYQEHPEAARITLRVKSSASDLTDPLHCAISPRANPGVVWRSGAHPGVGGAGDVPCSGDLLLGALAACQEITLRMVAAAMGIELESLEVEAIGELDLRGTLGLDRDTPVGFTNIRCQARVAVKDDGRPERAKRLLENAERYCVVLNTLRTGVNVESEFQLETARAEVDREFQLETARTEVETEIQLATARAEVEREIQLETTRAGVETEIQLETTPPEVAVGGAD